MSICRFKRGERVRCIDPDPYENYLQGKLYEVFEDNDRFHQYIRVIGEDSVSRSMYRERFVRVTQKEFTDEEYERLLV